MQEGLRIAEDNLFFLSDLRNYSLDALRFYIPVILNY